MRKTFQQKMFVQSSKELVLRFRWPQLTTTPGSVYPRISSVTAIEQCRNQGVETNALSGHAKQCTTTKTNTTVDCVLRSGLVLNSDPLIESHLGLCG
ncbi:hypothetical protein BaRGS_00008124 [Batillaria attramentaria]|uniref:Uncharacterized protein n=1 Tax=Batillaria attramentaria TaxID=370345 RepID=A0ABD0LMB7_9CAEN